MNLHLNKDPEEGPSVPESNNKIPEVLTVESVQNHVYFYSTVNSDRGLALMKQIRNLDNTLRNEHGSRGLPADHPPTPIWLHIQSGGGDIFSGLAISDQLKQIETPIYSVVEGYCASAATMISMACSKRFIQPSGFMLIHQVWSVFWGTYEEFKDEAHLLDMVMEKIIDFYSYHSKLKKNQIKTLLKRDSWFNSYECLKNGFVDEVME